MGNSGYDLTSRASGPFEAEDREKEAEMDSEITIRQSTDSDRQNLVRLAELDSGSAPAGDALLAFVDDELRAAVTLESGVVLADPFYPTAELVQLLRTHAGQRNGRTHLLGLPTWRHAAEAA
jgi:hypothetical protein